MSNREQFHIIVVKLGIKIVLEELIKMLDKHDEDYILRLKSDLQVALKNYEDRYAEEEE